MTKKIYLSADDKAPASVADRAKLRFVFDDETFTDFELSKCNEEIKLHSAWHGVSQIVGDTYSGAAKAENPLAFTKESVRDKIAQLYRGDLRATGEARVSDLALAISRVTGAPIDEAHDTVEEMSDEDKKVWRAKKKIAVALAEIGVEKAAAKVERMKAKAAEAAASDGDEDEDEDEDLVLPTRTKEAPAA